jgi:hypothetical protein
MPRRCTALLTSKGDLPKARENIVHPIDHTSTFSHICTGGRTEVSSGARYAALLLRAASSSACRPCCLVSTDRRATVTDPKSVSTPTPQGFEESGGEISTL